jgi:hypothetical protein
LPSGRQLILLNSPQENETASSLGIKRELLEMLSVLNTSPDGSSENGGTVAYGPGITVEFPMVDDKDEVFQALISVTDEDIAWSVLSRICQRHGWALMDPDSGRTFTG